MLKRYVQHLMILLPDIIELPHPTKRVLTPSSNCVGLVHADNYVVPDNPHRLLVQRTNAVLKGR